MLRALLLAGILSVIPSMVMADEVVEYVGFRFTLTAEQCKNDELAFYAMLKGVDPEELLAGKVEGTSEGKEYKAKMCYALISEELIFVVDENANMGMVPYDPKPIL